jgi:hypothetical protein
MIYLLIVFASILIAPGCSPAQRIAESTNAIRLEAAALADYGTKIGNQEVVTRANRIDLLAGGIAVDLSGVEDRTSDWQRMAIWIAAAVSLVAIAFILWSSGLGTAVRLALNWIPRRQTATAEMAVSMLDPARPESEREFVAVARASDPLLDAAFRRASKQRKAKP